MAKRKISKLRTILVSIVALVISAVISFGTFTFLGLPDSYVIPDTVQGSQNITSAKGIDKDKIVSNDLSIHFLELGNKYTGDCTLIKVGKTEILIDAGSKVSSIPYIKEYLDRYVEDKLDYVIVTHAHEDHYAGFATNNGTDSLFDMFEIGTIIQFANTNQNSTKKLYSNYLRERDEAVNRGAVWFDALECINEETKNINGNTVQAKNEFQLGDFGLDIKMQILYQRYYEELSNTENNYSVCLQIVQGSNKYLFTGDLEGKGEESLVSSNINSKKLGKVQLYKAGHHGSKTSSTSKFLEVIEPEIVCVCCCAGSSEYTSKNENQFPTQEFINRVSVYTDKIYVTTLCLDYSKNSFESFNGIIVYCASKSENNLIKVEMYFSNNNKILKETEWFKNNRVWPNNS